MKEELREWRSREGKREENEKDKEQEEETRSKVF